MFRTRITELFGIKYPVLCGGLHGFGRAELVAAVANAGGLGFITAATFDEPEAVRAEIHKARELTDKPIGLNINLFPSVRPQPVEEWAHLAVAERIPLVESSGRSPEGIVGILKGGGVKLMHKVTGVRYARTAERLGCDAVCVVGSEGGGETSRDRATTVVLVPACVDAVSIPVVAAGGFADGRGLAVALALGAEAVLMGTRFLATQECPGHPNWKRFLVDCKETDTVYVLGSIGTPIRMFRNAYAERIMQREQAGASAEELIALVSGQRGKAAESGDIDDGIADGGLAVGLIHDIPTVKQLMDRIIEEAIEARQRLDGIVPSK